MMEINTIEKRLKEKADAIGVKRANKLCLQPSELRDAFRLCQGMYPDSVDRRNIIQLSGWNVAVVCKEAMTKLYQQQALEELRKEIVEMSDRLVDLIGE